MNSLKAAGLVFLILFAGGCVPASKVLEDVQLIQAVGYDYMGEDEFQVTDGATYTPPGVQSEPENVVLTAVGKTSKSIRQKIQAQSTRPVEVGRVGIILFDQEITKYGIGPIVDNLQRDPNIGRDISLCVSEGKAFEILSSDIQQEESVSQYVTDIVSQNMDRTIPSMNLHHFLFQYRGDGFDPFLPLIKNKDQAVEVTGVALLKDDKLAGTLDLQESYMMKILYEKANKGIIEVDSQKKNPVSIQNLSSKAKYHPRKELTGYKMSVSVKMDGRVMEAGGLDLTRQPNIKKLEKKTEKILEEEMLSLLKKLQELDVDPLGIKEQFRQEGYRDWKKLGQKVQFDVHADVRLIQAGIME
ncbi:Ger(x)C family spore germination protein [Metabacillus indicus]|uniref:Ger(x)C family spore germination protein n=1 Tax=Metabacillus indicus TaxID=246786 RepID=UPI002A0150CF|nr:Ger(x)C family spore germination protein [Metabacillus indicus]MDX8290495.1 Ger(x)C family spore germination protein [Metabacillus indicus]